MLTTQNSPARTRSVVSRNNRQTATIFHAADMTHVAAIFSARLRLLLLLLLLRLLVSALPPHSSRTRRRCRSASPGPAPPRPGDVPSGMIKRSIGRSVGLYEVRGPWIGSFAAQIRIRLDTKMEKKKPYGKRVGGMFLI